MDHDRATEYLTHHAQAVHPGCSADEAHRIIQDLWYEGGSDVVEAIDAFGLRAATEVYYRAANKIAA